MPPHLATRVAPTGGTASALRQLRWWRVVLGCLGVVGLVGVGQLTVSPTFIHRITVVNPTRYTIQIDVTNATHDGWTSVTIVDKQSTTVAEEVIDQGSGWILRFSAQADDGGELVLTRAQLARSGWHVTIPSTVSDRLENAGAPPTP
jgi:hypothetical protein